STALPRLAVLFVLSAASSPCPDLNLIHYILIAYAVPVLGFLRGSGFAGLPATVMPSGMSHTITAPAPIQLPSFPNGVENVGRKAVYAP
ncbi:TPA: hypothetical protein ACJJKN_001944, partial [Neisseria meningitidis]